MSKLSLRVGGSRKSHKVQTFAVQTTPNGGGRFKKFGQCPKFGSFFFDEFPNEEFVMDGKLIRCHIHDDGTAQTPSV